MASSISAQQPAQQSNAEESWKDFESRMSNMVSRLGRTDTVFFYKHVSRTIATEVVPGPYAYSLEFPRAFITQHCKKFGKDVTFETTNSHQTWPVKITIRIFKDARFRVFAYGVNGWKAFVMDNHIKVGDILIFKLVRWAHFEVVIGRSPTKVDSYEDNGDEDNATHQASLWAASSNNISLWSKFIVTIHRPSQPEYPEKHFYLEKDLSLVVPSQFWELHSDMLECHELKLKGPTKTVTMVKVERFYNEEVQEVRLGHLGWKAFLLTNNLAVGDVLEFTLVANSSFIVDVVD